MRFKQYSNSAMRWIFTLFVQILLIHSATAQSYCIGGPINTTDSEIIGVKLVGDTDSISNYSSNCGTTGVQDFTHLFADLTQYQTYSLEVTMGTCGISYNGSIAAWIDFNGDGDFNDQNELIGTDQNNPTSTKIWTFTVPVNASIGNTRMRIVQHEGATTSAVSPCGTFSWGSVEDYSIQISSTSSPIYCSAGPSSKLDSEITGVKLVGDTDSISNYSSSCGATGVQGFTNLIADVTQSQTYTLDVTMGTCLNNFNGALAAWIDFNGDGDFDDNNEQIGVYQGIPTSIQTWVFTVPMASSVGLTRMRVMQQEGGTLASIAPCNTFQWGAVEDYSIQIKSANAQNCETPSNLQITTSTNSAALTWDVTTAYNSFIVEYGPTGFFPGTGNTFAVSTDSAFIT